MAEFPAMPLWTDAYLADTIHLSTLEHGAYLMLLMSMWRSKDQTLPDDDKLLAKYARLTPGQWCRIKPVVMAFFSSNDGMLSNGRLSDEHEAVKRLTMQRSNAGKASALKRKNRASTDVQRSGNGNSTPTPTPIPRVDASASTARATNLEFENEFWIKYPHKVGKRDAEKAYANARKRAEKQPILDGLDRYIASKPQDRNWCNPSTFLNQDRWTDEPAPPQTGKPDDRDWRKAKRDAAIKQSRRNMEWNEKPDSPRSPEHSSPTLLAPAEHPKKI